MEHWLSVSSVRQPKSKPTVFFSVPKKLVRLATDRNRLKRLLREALRKRMDYNENNVVYHFRVMKRPSKLTLAIVEEALRSITL